MRFELGPASGVWEIPCSLRLQGLCRAVSERGTAQIERALVTFELNHEPQGRATWAAGDATTDWNSAAERCGKAIQTVNSDALIIVEWIEKVRGL